MTNYSTGRRALPGRKSRRQRQISAVKYLILAAIIAYIVLLLLFTSGSTKSFSKVQRSVESVLDTEALIETDVQGLKRYYGLNSADYDGVMLYISEASMSAEEVLLIKVRTEEQVQKVRAAVEKRLENRKNDFSGYAPKQAQLIEQAQLSVRGKYIFLAVSSEAEQYKEAFSKSL